MNKTSASMWVAFLLISISGPSWGFGDTGGVQGGGYYSAIPVNEKLQFGDLKITTQRNFIQVPEDYGKLISITPHKGGSVLWFQNEEGVIRNVVMATEGLYIIQRGGGFQKEK